MSHIASHAGSNASSASNCSAHLHLRDSCLLCRRQPRARLAPRVRLGAERRHWWRRVLLALRAGRRLAPLAGSVGGGAAGAAPEDDDPLWRGSIAATLAKRDVFADRADGQSARGRRRAREQPPVDALAVVAVAARQQA
eukprot:Transcript_6729.p5 GENE.Transcript_6729~~Transcript_6729.p5  ORF type:complete len:139 (+),score=12.85 Transcript_6729:69-485(+)